MDQLHQLNLKACFERAEAYFPHTEIVTRLQDNSVFRYTFADFAKRVRRLASALSRLGMTQGQKIGTIAWNDYRHLELYYAVPCQGAVIHTINLRLSDEHLIHIINHAEDEFLFIAPDMIPTIERLAPALSRVKAYIVLDKQVPETTLSPVYAYEELLADGDEHHTFGDIDENMPSGMCYTSATTGTPKGVVYTHRGTYLHALVLTCADTLAISTTDALLLIVPMFHVNAWGIPYAGLWMGSKFVLPGPRPTPADMLRLMESEKVTLAAGAVTVGVEMLNILRNKPHDLSSMRGFMLGGQATPRAVMEEYIDKYGFPIYTAWGATEMGPIATFSQIKGHQKDWTEREKIDVRVRQGIPAPGAQIKILNEDGEQIPWDNSTAGEVYAAAPWAATSYYNDERSKEGFADGWWKSGDIATADEEGVLRLVDRAKDLIKSGGEWISSVDLENALIAHPAVREACVVAAPDEKWLERPWAYVALEEDKDKQAIADELHTWLAERFAKWWLPDRFEFVDEIPKTGVGKFNKRLIRDWASETASATKQKLAK